MKAEINAKEKILQAAMELIRVSAGDINTITIRAIAEKAGIGVGLINYHFQNKENLITLCVQRMIGNVIMSYRPAGGAERDLTANVKAVADFLVENPALSQISILADHQTPQASDNTMKTVQGFGNIFSSETVPSHEKKLKLFALVSFVQALFLRRDMSKELFGADFRDKPQRDKMIDWIVQQLFQDMQEK